MPQSLLSSQQAASVDRWLRRHGFETNPFADHEADRELRLPEYFIETPYYIDILGSAAHPRSMVIYADRGCGKSAHRLMTVRACRVGGRYPTILAVEYTSFGWLAEVFERGLRESLLRHHLVNILGYTIEAFIQRCMVDSQIASQVPFERLGRLKWFWEMYGSTAIDPAAYFGIFRSPDHDSQALDWVAFKTMWQANTLSSVLGAHPELQPSGSLRFLATLNDTPAEPLDVSRLSAGSLYYKLVEIVIRSGFEAVYVLVDRADEVNRLASHIDLVADMLEPLMSELPLMECPGVAFKFFLPVEIADDLGRRQSVRTDRLMFRELIWQESALNDMLQQRLAAYSGGKVIAFGELCDGQAAADIETGLIHLALGNPRNLLRLAEEIVVAHCQSNGEALLITQKDWKTASTRYGGAGPVQVIRPPTKPVLRLDRRTRTASIGTNVIKLTDTHFTLLWYLAQHPGRTIATPELTQQVTGTMDALRTAVRRIRQQIESDRTQPVYLITDRGQGLRIENVTVVRDTTE